MSTSNVELEVHKTSGEEPHVSLLQGSGEQHACGVNEADEDLTLGNVDNLRGSGVGVRRHETALGVVEPGKRKSLSVESRVVDASEARGDSDTEGADGGGVSQTTEQEVGGDHGGGALARQAVEQDGALQVGDAVVVDRISVCGNSH